MLDMMDLKELFEIADNENAEYIFVSILLPNSSTPEVILNKRENFESKKEYYLNNYTNGYEYPELKANRDIKIIDFGLLQGDFNFLFNPLEGLAE